MSKRLEKLLESSEFQSSLVRVAIWVFAVTYVGLSLRSEHSDINTDYYVVLFAAYLIIFIAIIVSVYFRPVWQARLYFSLVVDVTATSFAIYLTNDVTSPFFIIYFWLFISYGTRYGKRELRLVSLLSVVAYLITVFSIPGWQRHSFDVSFVWLSLILLPFYQSTLLRKLHAAKQQAEQARQEAVASSQAKGTFLANMSHEIRTPLNGLMSMGQLLLNTPLNEVQQEYAENLVSSGRALGTVINEVLDFSKIEAGVLEIRPADFKLRPLLNDVVQLMGFSAQAKSLQLELRCDPALGDNWHADASRLRQVLINLIGNAIRFTSEGEVALCVDHDGKKDGIDHIRFSVIDTGIGIDSDKQDKLFERFTQLDNSLSRGHGGTGLGLAISKHLVEAMGGQIGFHSVLGKGSTFWFSLPLGPARGKGEEAAEAVRSGGSLAGLHILLVDDDAINRLAGMRMLEQQGCQVMLANDGREALQCLKSYDVDVVLMDVHMPNLDGIETTRRIREAGKLQLPIIGVTASVMKDELERYHEAGMNDVVAKPIEVAALMRAIDSAYNESVTF